MSARKLLIGVLAGVAAGTVLGILLAPDKGSNTRKKLSNKADKLKEDYSDFTESMTKKYESLMGKAKAKMEGKRMV